MLAWAHMARQGTFRGLGSWQASRAPPMSDIPFPQLHRIVTEHGSHIEPPLDAEWSDLDKLRWHAAVTRVDHGGEIDLTVEPAHVTINGESIDGLYSIKTRGNTCGAYAFYDAWTYINGIDHGLRIAEGRRERI